VTKEIPAEADPTGENARWNATLDALRAIADNPDETPTRRYKARKAWESAVMPAKGVRAVLASDPPSGTHHTRSGGNFMQTQAVEEGWDK